MAGRVALFLLVVATLSSAQDTRPATAPADPSTPKGALRLLNLSLRDGDAPAIAALFEAGTDGERRAVQRMANFAAVLVALHRAAAEAFGEEGANAVTGDASASSAEAMAALDKAEVRVDGPAATVTFPGAADAPVHLVRVGGEWKLPLSELDRGADPATVDERLSQLARLVEDARGVAEEIRAGKYKSAEKAAQAWRTRMMQDVAPRPATGPSTRR